MQIIQWLFKLAHEPPRESNTSCLTIKKGSDSGPNDRKGSQRVKIVGLGCSDLSLFSVLRKRDIAKTCFYTTHNLRRVGSCGRRRSQHCDIHSMKMKKEDIARGLGIGHKADLAAHAAGNKVLPISEATLPSSASIKEQCGAVQNKDKAKGDKAKTLSKMKELLKWAAAVKAEKGGKYISRKLLHFRNRVTLKAVPDDDQLSNDSPKISFRWEVESCSTTSSVYSAMSMASSTRNDHPINLPWLNSTPAHDKDQSNTTHRAGNWITTDTDFVVLAL